MRPHLVLGSLVLVASAVIAIAVGQQPLSDRRDAGNYSVASAGNSAILVDTQTGRSWLLNHSADRARQPVWLPIERIDDAQLAAKWHAEEQERLPLLAERANLQAKLTELQARYKDYARLGPRAGANNAASAAAIQLEKQISDLETQLKELQSSISKLQ